MNKTKISILVLLFFCAVYTNSTTMELPLTYASAGRNSWVVSTDISPDGDAVAVANDGTISIYTFPDLKMISSKELHSNYAQSVKFAKSGRSIFSVGWDGFLRKTDINEYYSFTSTGSIKINLNTARPTCLALSKDGKTIATNGSDNTVLLFETGNLKQTGSIRVLKNKPVIIVFAEKDKMIYLGTNKGEMVAYDLENNRTAKKWKAHSDDITGILVDEFGQNIITSGKDGRVKIWDNKSFKNKNEKKVDGPITAISRTPDGKFIFPAESDKKVYVLDASLKSVRAPMKTNGKVLSLSCDTSGRFMAAGLSTNKVETWNTHHIKEITMAYDRPCKLEIVNTFDDKDGLIPNNAIDGGEEVFLHTRVINKGEGAAYGVILNISGDNEDLSFSKRINIGTIPPGMEKSVDLPVIASLDAGDGSVTLRFHAREERKHDAKIDLKINVFELKKPEFVITEVELDDSNRGSTRGNGNGIPENNETVEAVVFIKNSGEGLTRRANLRLLDHSAGITPSSTSVKVPDLYPGQTKPVKLRFTIPRDCNNDEFKIVFSVSDEITKTATEETKIWSIIKNKPLLSIDIVPLSKLENGRSVKLQVNLINHGDLAAKNVSIMIASKDGIKITDTATAKIATLPAKGKDSRIFQAYIPVDFNINQATFQSKIKQEAFEGVSVDKTFDVTLRKPVLEIVNLNEQVRVRQGENMDLHLALRNRGDLPAENISLYIDMGRLEKQFRFSLNKLEPGETHTFDEVSHYIPMGIEAGQVTVETGCSQSYFDNLSKSFTYTVESRQVASGRVTPKTGLIPKTSIAPGVSSYNEGKPTTIKISNLPKDRKVYSSNYKIKVAAKCDKGISDISIRVNGRIQDRLSNRPEDLLLLHELDDKSIIYDVELIDLVPGKENIVEVKLRNKENESETVNERIYYERRYVNFAQGAIDINIDVNRPPKFKNKNEKAVALLVGISKYQKRDIPEVTFAVQDALAIKEYLINAFGYYPDNIIELYNEEATKSKIEVAVKEMLRSKATPGASDIFFYYSGHGGPDIKAKKGYLIPYDCDPEPRRIKISGYPISELYADLRKISGKDYLIVIDACFSGESEGGSIIGSASPTGISVNKENLDDENSVIFTASSGTEIASWFDSKKHGLFTYYFLNGLKGYADIDGDNEITGGELHNYLKNQVSSYAEKRGRTQNPQIIGKKDKVIIRTER